MPTRQLAAALKPLIESLVSIVGDETSRLQSIVSRLLQCARSLPFTQACFTQALNLRGNIGLSP
ncbi:MAG TPA: hypothetical protein VH253_04205 [Phycisphaerae bacterium]|nr:hypothetical protein [Phycisphaerae bacterium]